MYVGAWRRVVGLILVEPLVLWGAFVEGFDFIVFAGSFGFTR